MKILKFRVKRLVAILLTVLIFALTESGLAHPADSLASDTTGLLTITLNNDLVIAASRYSGNSYNRPEAISSLSSKEMLGMGRMSTPEVMSNIPGVWMQKTNHGGGSPFIRGLTGYQTLILVDGIRLNNAIFRSGPNQYLNTIDQLSLDHIEVIRGSGSVEYGSDAIGGVAQLFFKEPKFSAQGFRVSGGLYGKYMTSDMENTGRAELRLSDDRIAFIGGFTYKNLGDIRAGGDLGTLNSTGYDEYSTDFKLKWRASENHVLTMAYQFLEQYDVPLFHQISPRGSFLLNNFETQQRQLGYVRLQSFYQSKWISSINYTISYQRSLERRQTIREGETALVEATDDVDTYGAILEVESVPMAFWNVVSGFELYHDFVGSTTLNTDLASFEILSSRGLYPNGSKSTNFAFYSLHTANLDRWTFTTGGRLNGVRLSVSDSDFGTSTIKPLALVGNAGVVYKFSKTLHLTGALNSSFRAPNINDVSSLGIADFRYEIPNFDLEPEKALSIEGGIKSRVGGFSGTLTLYNNKLRDLISNVLTTFMGQDSVSGAQVFQRQNVNEAVIRGIEAEGEYLISTQWKAKGSLTYTYGQNQSGKEPLRRTPPLNGGAMLTFSPNKRLATSLNWLFAAKQERLSGGDIRDNRIAEGGTPGWNVINLRAQYKYHEFLTFNLGLQNLLDEAYRIHGSGIDGVGRSLWISAQLNL